MDSISKTYSITKKYEQEDNKELGVYDKILIEKRKSIDKFKNNIKKIKAFQLGSI